MIEQTNKLFIPVLKSVKGWLVLFAIVSMLLDEQVVSAARVGEGLREPSMGLIVFTVILSLTWSILSNALLVLVSAGEAERHLSPGSVPSTGILLQTQLKPLTIESLRAFCWILIFLLALVIPGIIKYIRYTFVPYVVLFDKRYQQGEVDALERSSELSRGVGLKLFAVIALFFAISIVLQGVAQSWEWTLFSNPVMTIIAQIAMQLISLYFALLLYSIYRQRVQVTN